MPDADATPTPPDLNTFYKGRAVCVTGGAGFIGSSLAHALIARGAKVSIIDDLSSGLESNLAPIRDSVRFVRGSILDPDALADSIDGSDIVFHQAALTSVPRSVKNPRPYHEVNAAGTLAVLDAARKNFEARSTAPGSDASFRGRVVSASSSSVYGDQPISPKVETMKLDPRSPYAASKCAGEHFMSAFAHCYAMSTVCLRYFNIFGPRQRPDSAYAAVIPKFATSMLAGKPFTIYGDGSQTRDYTHIDNAVYANLLAGASDADLKGDAINIACGGAHILTDLVTMMADALGVTPQVEYAPPRPGEVLHSMAAIDRARELIGYEPVMDFETGLAEVLEHYRKGVGSRE